MFSRMVMASCDEASAEAAKQRMIARKNELVNIFIN
jgi:hypothetical protein